MGMYFVNTITANSILIGSLELLDPNDQHDYSVNTLTLFTHTYVGCIINILA